jgi:pimeloyl-ACP methyl ester carboxylesterase
MRRGYADTRFGQIHYAGTGDGPPLLLLHPTPRSGRAFARLQALLSNGYRTLALDTLGFGNSDPLPPEASMPLLADSVAAAMDALDIGRAHVLGMHTGNKIAAALAARHPTRIDRLVLLGMTHSLVVARDSRDAAIHALVDQQLEGASEGPLSVWARRWRDLAGVWWDDDIVARPGVSLDDLTHLAERASELAACGASIDPIYRANFAFDLAEALSAVSAPTLVVELATAAEAGLGDAGAQMAAALPDGRAVRIEEADRAALWWTPELIAKPVRAFLDES